jgi:hypothetical protein
MVVIIMVVTPTVIFGTARWQHRTAMVATASTIPVAVGPTGGRVTSTMIGA